MTDNRDSYWSDRIGEEVHFSKLPKNLKGLKVGIGHKLRRVSGRRWRVADNKHASLVNKRRLQRA